MERDSGQFTQVEISEGTATTARFIIHPDTRGAAVRAATASFSEHTHLAYLLLCCAASLTLDPSVQVRLMVDVEMLGAILDTLIEDQDADDQEADDIPF